MLAFLKTDQITNAQAFSVIAGATSVDTYDHINVPFIVGQRNKLAHHWEVVM